MYQVSNAFLNAMKSPVQEHTITGTIGSVSFSEENIVDVDCIIRTAAAHNDNPEIAGARSRGIPAASFPWGRPQ